MKEIVMDLNFSMFVFDFLRIVLGCTLVWSVVGKSSDQLLKHGITHTSLLKFLRSIEYGHRPFIYSTSFLILAMPFYIAPFIGAALILCLIASMQLLKYLRIVDDCNCYGMFEKKTPILAKILPFIVFGASLCIFIFTLFEHQSSLSERGNTLLFLAVLALPHFVIAFKNIFTVLVSKIQYVNAKNFNPITPLSQLSFEDQFVVGELLSGEEITFGKLSQLSPVLVIVGTALNCKACKESKPLLNKIATSFGSDFQMVFVYDKLTETDAQQQGGVHLQGRPRFFEKISPIGFPFAIVVLSENLSQIGSTINSVESLWTALFRILNVTTKLG